MENNTGKNGLSKTVVKSVWVKDLRERQVMMNDEMPSSRVDFSNSDVLAKTVQRFKITGLHSATSAYVPQR